MKNYFAAILCLALLVMGYGCTPFYNTAVDERNVRTIAKDEDIWSTNVEVIVVQCNVVFVGLVGSDKEIETIIAHAKTVGGIRSVKSFLKVAPHHNQ